jgi:putative flippase GtrA
VLGAQVAYWGNRRWTFRHDGRFAQSWPRFQATAAAGAVLGMAIVAAAVRLQLHYLAGQVLATGASLLLTYAVNRRWAFAPGRG